MRKKQQQQQQHLASEIERKREKTGENWLRVHIIETITAHHFNILPISKFMHRCLSQKVAVKTNITHAITTHSHTYI